MRRHQPDSLFVCGGETAHAILRELQINHLNLLGEILPGVPLARTLDRQLTVVTKSGGFGDPDTLQRLAGKFVKS